MEPYAPLPSLCGLNTHYRREPARIVRANVGDTIPLDAFRVVRALPPALHPVRRQKGRHGDLDPEKVRRKDDLAECEIIVPAAEKNVLV